MEASGAVLLAGVRSYEKMRAVIGLFGREVIPAFRD
jgi:hypothetical protein